ncbi:MAG: carboxypeptidase-like regulatory domain-containing protein [Fidelibacterota bacterium]|nr:MAG: carboxypeptidase-like regulatory domain-containing protein [Candidatus Neomarinimicrobiota bacterium]
MNGSSRNRKLAFTYALVSVLCLLYVSAVYPATGGKIAGRIFDEETGDPLPGANIIIEGTTQGAAADENGEYFILNVTPGWHVVRGQVIGYTVARIVGVRVQSDITTTVDIAMAPTVIEGEEVIVTSERPVVELGVGNTTTILSGDELNEIPQLQLKDILSRQAGLEVLDTRGLIVRGAREHELSLTLDGMETRDPIDNNVYMRVNPDAVQELEIQLGGFSARYGNARAGIINVTTKEGSPNYNFTLDVRGSKPGPKHFGERWYERERKLRLSAESISSPILNNPRVVWNNEPDPGTRLPRYDTLDAEIVFDSWETIASQVDSADLVYGQFYNKPHLCQELYKWRTRPEVTVYGDKPDINANATLGGPVPLLRNTYFFASGRFERSYYLVKASQDYFQDWGGGIKINSQLTPKLKLVLTGNYALTSGVNRTDAAIGTRASGVYGLEDFNPTKNETRTVFETPEAFAWFIQTRAGDNFENEIWPYSELSVSTRVRKQLGLNLTYMLSKNTFLDFTLDYGEFEIQGRYDTVKRDTTQTVTLQDQFGNTATLTGPYAMAPAGFFRDLSQELWGSADRSLERITGVRLAGSYYNREDSWAGTLHLNTTITSQVSKHHQLMAGIDFAAMHIIKDEYRNYDIVDPHWWRWDVSPKQGSAYIEDKLEFKQMIAIFGMRADFSIPDEWFDVENHPFQAWLSKDWVQLPDGVYSFDFEVEPADPRIEPIRVKPPIKYALAPRLAISHPIGTKAKIYFNYGHFYQLPDPEKRYYQVRRYGLNYRGAIHRLGNPFLDYEKTIQYEIGYSQSLLDIFSIDITAYYRDVSQLAAPYTYSGYGDSSYIALSAETPGAGLDTVIEYSRVTYDTWGSTAFEDVRGIEIQFAKKWGRFFTGSVNCSFEIYSTGRYGFRRIYQNTASDPRYWEGTNTKPSARPKINIHANFHTPGNFGPSILGMRPIANLSLNILFWLNSQTKQNYNAINRTQEYQEFQNVQWKPHHATDLRFTKRFGSGRARITPVFYVQILNLFNTKNMFRGAFKGDHDPAPDGEIGNYLSSLKYDEGDRPGEYGKDYLYLPDPEPFYLFLNPRQIFFGFRLEM